MSNRSLTHGSRNGNGSNKHRNHDLRKKDKGEHFTVVIDDRKKKVYPDSPRT